MVLKVSPLAFQLLKDSDLKCTGSPMAEPVFWIALICQLIVVLGYFWFYRKEQLCMCLLTSCWIVSLTHRLPQLDHDHDTLHYLFMDF